MFARNPLRMSAALLLIVAVSLAACAPAAAPTAAPALAPTNPPAPPAAAPTAAAPVAKAVTLQIAQNEKLGKFIADGDGHTLYLFTKDASNTSNCYDKCEQAWPPLLTAGQPTLKEGISTTVISTTVRKDGSTQLTYNGWPLYYYAKDAAPGDTTGQAVGNVWWVVSGEGNAIKPATLAVTPTEKLGQVLVDGDGRTLYLFTKDTKDTTNCYDKCEQAWPPLLTIGQPTLQDGTQAALLGTTQRKDGTMQVTYNGAPLYYYFKDHAAGDTTGQGVGDVWYVVTADGQAVK
jgi:predicted lipoprotein with Yx(FWY)xxD motif